MTIKYTYNKIEVSGKIVKAASTLKLLTSEVYDQTSVTFFAVLSFSAKYTRTIQFVKIKDKTWEGSLVLSDDDIKNIVQPDTYLELVCVSPSGTQHTPHVTVEFDIPAIKLTAKRSYNNDIAELRKEMAALKQTLNSIAKNYSLNLLMDGTTDYIKPGMVPMAIDGGKFIAQYPFADTLKAVNDKRSADGEITITPEDIPITDGYMLSDYLTAVKEALDAQNIIVSELSDQMKKANNKLAEFEIKFAQLTNKGLL